MNIGSRSSIPALLALPALLAPLALSALGCGSPARTPPPAPDPAATSAIPLPGGDADGVRMDYLLFDPRTNAVWVPAGNTGSVDVLDIASGRLARIAGFPTREIERGGKRRVVGPSAATLGPAGTVYVGNRGDSSICAIDERTLARGACGVLDAMPDGIAYVGTTGEVWVTTPRDRSIRILDATTLAERAKLSFEGEPEGFAPDAARGRFYTNLEDKDVTLAIDLASRRTVATWKAGCGEDGPRGLVLAEPDGLLVVACTSKVEILDVGHDGAIVGSIDTGDGVDNVDYAPATRLVYAGAAEAGTLTIARLDARGALTRVAVVPTRRGARNGVVDAEGRVYLAHSAGAELMVVPPVRDVRPR